MQKLSCRNLSEWPGIITRILTGGRQEHQNDRSRDKDEVTLSQGKEHIFP